MTTVERWQTWDKRISQRLRLDHRPGWLTTCFGWLSHTGDGWLWVLLPLALGLFSKGAWRHAGWTLLAGVLLTAATVGLLKVLFRRQRPQGQWGTLYRKTDPHSFPSGHAARAAMLGLVGWAVLPPPWAAALSLWGGLVALSRVLMGVHYLSDVLAGVLLGLALGGAMWWLQGLWPLW